MHSRIRGASPVPSAADSPGRRPEVANGRGVRAEAAVVVGVEAEAEAEAGEVGNSIAADAALEAAVGNELFEIGEWGEMMDDPPDEPSDHSYPARMADFLRDMDSMRDLVPHVEAGIIPEMPWKVHVVFDRLV